MFNNKIDELHFENFLWIVFAGLCLLNISGDYNQEEYLETNNQIYQDNANKIFKFTIIVTLIIYIYFFIRNYNAYQEVSEDKKDLYLIKLLGSSFLIAGILLLLYFQDKQANFTGSPSI